LSDDTKKPGGSRAVSGGDPGADDVAAWFARARVAHCQGNLLEAQSCGERVLRSRPNHPEVLNFLGILQQERGQSTQAEQLFRRAIRAAPGHD